MTLRVVTWKDGTGWERDLCHVRLLGGRFAVKELVNEKMAGIHNFKVAGSSTIVDSNVSVHQSPKS